MTTFAASGKPLAAQSVLATPALVPTRAMPGKVSSSEDWFILDLPVTATQLEYGAEVYRLVCKACHGDVGQGLTPEWRATWNPADQNCWQSKCHALNHPPDGFTFPVAPAINNLTKISAFPTARHLQAYIQFTMPWYKPGGLTDERAWQVTAYVLQLNGIDAGPLLDSETAAKIRLAPEIATKETPAPPDGVSAMSNTALPVVVAVAVLLAGLGGVFLRRRAKR